VTLLALAVLAATLAEPLASRVFPSGVFPELAAYCAQNPCELSPSVVSATYVSQGLYSSLFIIACWIRSLMITPDRKKRRDKSLMVTVLLAFTVISCTSQRFSFERSSLFANHVHEYLIYIMYPAMIMALFCTVAHFFLVSAQFERDEAALALAD